MKLTIFALLCLSFVFCVTCNDLNIGKREPGDILVASRALIRKPLPHLPRVAVSGYNAHGGNITAVRAVNRQGSEANLRIVKGGPGTNSVVVVATSQPGKGFEVDLDIYATGTNSSSIEVY